MNERKKLDGKRLIVYSMLASRMLALPEAKDILRVKRGNAKPSPCHCCLVRKDYLANCGCNTSRKLAEAHEVLVLVEMNRGRTNVLMQPPMHLSLLFLFRFLLVEIHLCINVHNIIST